MDVSVNGKPRVLSDGMTVAELLRELDVAAEQVVVEVNLKILKRAEHPQVKLAQGDQVEIVHFVGGGSDVRRQTSDVSIPRLLRSVVWGLKSEV